jgi:hypothetical protein
MILKTNYCWSSTIAAAAAATAATTTTTTTAAAAAAATTAAAALQPRLSFGLFNPSPPGICIVYRPAPVPAFKNPPTSMSTASNHLPLGLSAGPPFCVCLFQYCVRTSILVTVVPTLFYLYTRY